VVFLLLIFFLVATRFAQEDRELEVVLPSASEAKPLIEQPKELFVNINKEGQFFVDGRFMLADEVEQVMRRAVINNPVNQVVVIRADKRVVFDSVVTVMNLCNKVGIQDYMVTTAGEGG
jgi:biopolymer transport protein ExbD